MATAQERPQTINIPVDSLETLNAVLEHRHRVLLLLSDEMKARVDDLVRRTGYDQGELFNVAIAFFKIGLDAVEDGHRVGVVDDDREMLMDLTGFHENDPPGEPV
jgi:hypothetical protein